MPKISVIIPVYNLGKYLQEAITSVTSYKDDSVYELIIVNDGSTDEQTLQLLNSLEAEGYQVINQENLGLAAARNNGIKVAKGDYILPLDADNKLRHNYFDRSIDIFESDSNVDVVYGDKQYFGENSNTVVVDDFSFPQLCSYNYIDACACFRKSVWSEIGGYDENMPVMGLEDWDFWLRTSLNGFGFYHLREVSYDYRVRSDSMIYGTMKKKEELLNYILGKKELRVVKSIRESYHNGLEANYIRQSKNYRLGKLILDPVRKVTGLFK